MAPVHAWIIRLFWFVMWLVWVSIPVAGQEPAPGGDGLHGDADGLLAWSMTASSSWQILSNRYHSTIVDGGYDNRGGGVWLFVGLDDQGGYYSGFWISIYPGCSSAPGIP